MTYRRLLHALDNHGLPGLARRLLSRRSDLFRELTTPHPFDLARHTDTSGYIPGEQLSTGSPSDLYNTAYYAIAPSTLRHALALLPEPIEGFTFIDLGCGKGRALLVAHEFGFSRLIGVEIAAGLALTAAANTSFTPQISVLNVDAISVSYPETPLVIFLYHPFLGPVLRAALENLEQQLRRRPRTTYILTANPTYPRIWKNFDCFSVVWDFRFPLAADDAAADRHLITHERYTLRRGFHPLP